MNEINEMNQAVAGTIGINEAANQLRWFTSRKYSEEYYRVGYLPELDGVMEAARWIRRHGHTCMTNQSFRGLLSDIIGRRVSEEEAHTARVLTGVSAHLEAGVSSSLFVTNEEWGYIEHMVKGRESYPIQIITIETCLGGHVEIISPAK